MTEASLEFVASNIGPPPARVLEVGCGTTGELAEGLAAASYDVLAVDPEAPEGRIFRRVSLEALDDPGPFDAVVASRSLHHIHDLTGAVDKIASLTPLLVLEDFGWDLLDEPTLRWYGEQSRALRAAGHDPEKLGSREEWEAEHAGLHGYEAMRTELDRRFDERFFARTPYLYRYLRGAEELERRLIEEGAIRALGFRYVGAAKSR